jgi:hypothetical protein
MAALRTLVLPEAAELARTGGRPVDEGVCLRLLRVVRLASPGACFGPGLCEELEHTFEHRTGPVVGDEVRGAVDVPQFQVVGVVVEAVQDTGANVGVISPGQDACRRAQPVAPAGTAQDADGLGLDEVSAEGGARWCPGRFAVLGDENLDVFCGEGLPVRGEAGQHVARHPLEALAHQQGTGERQGVSGFNQARPTIVSTSYPVSWFRHLCGLVAPWAIRCLAN